MDMNIKRKEKEKGIDYVLTMERCYEHTKKEKVFTRNQKREKSSVFEQEDFLFVLLSTTLYSQLATTNFSPLDTSSILR